MKFKYSAALLVAAAVISTGCGKRDRDEAKKTKDGSDTFVYSKPDLKKHAERTTNETSERATDGNASPASSSEHASTQQMNKLSPSK